MIDWLKVFFNPVKNIFHLYWDATSFRCSERNWGFYSVFTGPCNFICKCLAKMSPFLIKSWSYPAGVWTHISECSTNWATPSDDKEGEMLHTNTTPYPKLKYIFNQNMLNTDIYNFQKSFKDFHYLHLKSNILDLLFKKCFVRSGILCFIFDRPHIKFWESNMATERFLCIEVII